MKTNDSYQRRACRLVLATALVTGAFAVALPNASARTCDLLLSTCAQAIAIADVTCLTKLGVKYCTGIGKPGGAGFSPLQLGGSASFSGSACGGPKIGDCGNSGSGSGSCTWGLLAANGCEKVHGGINVGSDSGIFSASYYVRVSSSARASTTLGSASDSLTQTGYKSL